MLTTLLERRIREGTLHLQLPDGTSRRFGQGEPEAHWAIRDAETVKRIVRDPDLELGDTYMEGGWDTDGKDLVALLGVLMRNFPEEGQRGFRRYLRLPRVAMQTWNRAGRSRRNVAHHYDIDGRIFRMFLDQDMQYSCAYFPEPGTALEDAQQAKCRHIARKLLLQPGQRVLDIGSGWGGLALRLAREADVQVTGLTLSREQLEVARKRAEQAGLSGQVEFRLQDYREHRGQYDRVVSVGMFEHVGPPNYRTFFGRVRQLLTSDGVALLHTIGRTGPPGSTHPWIRKHIFPGGYIPALSEVSRSVEKNGIVTTDLEVLRLHYADTLAAWRERFHRRWHDAADCMGESFCRMWDFYLASCEAAFRWRDLVVFQLQLATRLDTVPRTRDYLHRELDGSAMAAAARSA